MSPQLRVVLAEDVVLLREGLVQLLEMSGYQVAAAVGDAEGFLEAVDRLDPDLVITDVRMPPGHGDDGLQSAMELRRRKPDLPVVVLSQYTVSAYAVELLESTASGDAGVGYLLKERIGAVAEFVDAVSRVAAGETVIDPEVVRLLLGQRKRASPLERLTTREYEVLSVMAEGHSNTTIAEQLTITPSAVAKHTNNIFAKLELTEDRGHRRVLAVLRYLRG